jgi:hypothetical protein
MRSILVTIIALGVLSGTSAVAGPPVGAGKVYSGPEGVSVAVIPLTTQSSTGEKQALVYVQGTESEFDGKAMLHSVSGEGGPRTNYITQYKGEDFYTVQVRESYGSKRYDLWVPGRNKEITVSFDEKRTKDLDAEDVYEKYEKQKKDGTLGRMAAYNRKERETGQQEGFTEAVNAMNAACGTKVTATIDWKSVTDDIIKKYSVSSYCGGPLEALKSLCASPVGKKAVSANVKSFTCQFGPELKLEVNAGTVRFTTQQDAANQEEYAAQFFEKNLGGTAAAPSGTASGLEPPWGRGASLGEQLVLEKTSVCTDGKGHYVVVAPHEKTNHQLFYGDGKTFVQVPRPPWGISGTDFLEPRFFNKGANENFRGHDFRVYSGVELDKEKKTCAVRCGERTTPFTLVEPEQAQKMLTSAKYEKNPQKYVPYALLRDTKGSYYLVEKGFHPEDEKSFRVHVGQKGSLKLQQMKDIVSDSEGQIFSTKKGELRLVVDRSQSPVWIEGAKKKVELRVVPITENLQMIYNELGVYSGARLGTPCDDL